ncbi:MAG: manganese-dependent inorganic pyrophosphatase [Candidatus Gracilibacteria bacterium]|nr:manganese-dependent inorganic pyrophosphatase [Candidatus Gracilibacteria bacterium]
MSIVNVIGHKVPDTDSIISALVFAEYLVKSGVEAKAFRLGELNNETRFIFDNVGADVPELSTGFEASSKIALVDHNEKSQTVDNIDELDLEYIVDHHKIGALSTSKPIFVRFENIGSTNTLLYKMYSEASFEISKTNAILMISAIISDTLLFRSPTTTSEDVKAIEELNKIALIDDLEGYALKMFNAKSDLGDISVGDLIKLDYKEFDVGNFKIGAGTIETTNPDYSLNRKTEIVSKMQEIKSENRLDIIILSVVDILNEKNITIISDEHDEKIVKDVFGVASSDNLADLGARISRKKQIIPQLTEYYNKL